MSTNGQNSYGEYRILTASPMEVVRMLYEKAIFHVETARECLQQHDPEGRAKNVTKAFSILTELLVSLNDKHSPELSSRLKAFYDYLQWRLLMGHSQRDDRALEEVESLLRSMSEAWDVRERESTPEEAPAAQPAAPPKVAAVNPYQRQRVPAPAGGPVYL